MMGKRQPGSVWRKNYTRNNSNESVSYEYASYLIYEINIKCDYLVVVNCIYGGKLYYDLI